MRIGTFTISWFKKKGRGSTVEPGIKKFKNHSACMSCCFSRIQLSTNFGNGGKQSCPTCPVMVHRDVSAGSLAGPSLELTRKCSCLTGGSTQGGLGLYCNESAICSHLETYHVLFLQSMSFHLSPFLSNFSFSPGRIYLKTPS